MMEENELKALKHNWFIEALTNIKSLEGHNQDEIAKEIGVTPGMISKVKSGRSPVPDSLIAKLVNRYQIDGPYNVSSDMANEPFGQYLPDSNSVSWQEHMDVVNRNMIDLRRELMETYDHIGTLKKLVTTFETNLKNSIAGS